MAGSATFMYKSFRVGRSAILRFKFFSLRNKPRRNLIWLKHTAFGTAVRPYPQSGDLSGR
jgi:hypothetical protein